jgi:hypothetical protein
MWKLLKTNVPPYQDEPGNRRSPLGYAKQLAASPSAKLRAGLDASFSKNQDKLF